MKARVSTHVVLRLRERHLAVGQYIFTEFWKLGFEHNDLDLKLNKAQSAYVKSTNKGVNQHFKDLTQAQHS